MTTATLRPNGTRTTADSYTGAASAHAATSDDSDSSYFTESTFVAQMELGTFTLPAGAVTKQARVRARFRGDTLVATGYFALRKSPSTSGVTSVEYAQGTTLTDIAGSYTPATLTQADIDGLYIETYIYANAVRVYELYADIVYVEQPVTTVTAVSPDPYTASTIVPIAWSNTLDTDGGAQTRYRLKVFTDAQYGAGGFDPETSAAYYDSGEVVSASLSANTDALLTGDTYRAYVKVAQTVNGVTLWSDWAYDQFDLSVTTETVDSVVGTATNSEGKITVVVTFTGAATAEFVEVQRSIDGGTTWAYVRGAQFVAVDSAVTHTVVDYEVSNGQDVDYRARATYYSSGLPITGAWTESASSVSWSSDDTWLKIPADPTLNLVVEPQGKPVWARTRRHGEFQPIGGQAPVVVTDVLSKRRGQITVETQDSAGADALLAALEGGAVVLVQYPEALRISDLYAVVGSVTEQPVSEMADIAIWHWVLGLIEVDAPADPEASSA